MSTSRSSIEKFCSPREGNVPSTSAEVDATQTTKSPSVWNTALLKKQQSQASREGTSDVASPAKNSDATKEVAMVQNPGTPSGDASKSDKQYRKSARKNPFNVVECWQINLHRSKAASYNLGEVTKKQCCARI